MDTRYERVRIAVVKTSASVKTAFVVGTIPYSGVDFSYDYYGQEGEPINIAELITPSKTYLQGQDLFQHDGRLFFYGIKNEKNLNYQKYANDLQVDWVRYDTSNETNAKYHPRSFMRGEVYDFAIVFNYCDGTSSAAFHIPGCSNASGGGGGAGVPSKFSRTQWCT